MKLEKKSFNQPDSYKKQESVSKQVGNAANSYLVEDLQAELTKGKYNGYTLGYVRKNDDSYYQWLKKENLIETWGLVKSNQKVEPKKQSFIGFVATGGEVWLMIREVAVTKIFKPVDQSWLTN